MAFETLRQQLETDGDALVAKCAMTGITVEDLSFTIEGLQALQRVRGNGNVRETLLADSLLPVALAHSTLKWDDQFMLTSSIIALANSNPKPTPIRLQRNAFRAIVPSSFPSTPVASKADIFRLERMASARVCGEWKVDPWFQSAAGRAFVHAWDKAHTAAMPCLDLEKEEALAAVLYFGLQNAESLMQDCVETIDAAMDVPLKVSLLPAERHTVTEQVLRELRAPFDDVNAMLAFLPRALEVFADGYELIVEIAWSRAEDLRLASNGAADTEETQTALAIASTARHSFIQSVRTLSKQAEEWKKDTFTSEHVDKRLLEAIQSTMKLFERMNTCAGSVPIPRVSEPWLQGFCDEVAKSVEQMQAPFRGTHVAHAEHEHVVTVTSLENSASRWMDVETNLKNLPNTSGAGICFRLKNYVLLPLDSRGKVETKWIGGRVEPRESWLDGAWREFDEETFLRSDPWCDHFSRTAESDVRRVKNRDKWVPWKGQCEEGLLVAVSNGVSLQRNLQCPYPKMRKHTRDVWAEAFDQAPVEVQSKCLESARIIHESSDQGRKTYRTLVLDLEPLLPMGRVASIHRIPKQFSKYASEIFACSDPSFDDVFQQEPVDLNRNALREWEHSGFLWIKIEDIQSKRLQTCLNKI